MNIIKCSCGYTGCTTEVYIRESTGSVDLVVEHKNEQGYAQEQSISLNPNEIVQLIKELKSSLQNIT